MRLCGLDASQAFIERIGADVPVDYQHTPRPEITDEISRIVVCAR